MHTYKGITNWIQELKIKLIKQTLKKRTWNRFGDILGTSLEGD